MSSQPLAGVLFDLDGTLIDTAPDMAHALNRLLEEEGQASLDPTITRNYVSNGARGLVQVGFNIGPGHENYERLRQRFLDLYSEAICVNSQLFSGLDHLLEQLEAASIPWGIVTNKPHAYTDPLLKSLSLHHRASAVISGDTIPVRKPEPEPLHEACRRASLDANQCVYIGDAERDILAGKAANMFTIAALYGYIPPEENPQDWPADCFIDHGARILEILRERYTNL